MKRGTCALTLILLLAVIICAIGCAEEEAIFTPTITPSVTLTPGHTAAPTAQQTPTITPTHTYTPTPTPTMAELVLEITQPGDGAQVSTRDILVRGKTVPGAVVSALVDDTVAIADIDQEGNFSVTVSLEEGPNLIEVVASDQLGNGKSSSIVVIYVP